MAMKVTWRQNQSWAMRSGSCQSNWKLSGWLFSIARQYKWSVPWRQKGNWVIGKQQSCRKEKTRLVSSGWTTKRSPKIIIQPICNCAHERRLQKDSNLRQRYEPTIQVDLDNNRVRTHEAQEQEATKNEQQWYVPHHPVINPNNPEKVRRVCNAASEYNGVALNDKLNSGPGLPQNLEGIIFRLREHEIAMTAYIEAMFLQVEVPTADCKFLRFFWRKDFNNVVEIYEYTRHIFGVKSSPTCDNHALQQTGIGNKTLYPVSSRAIERNFDMVDFAKSVASEEEAIESYQQLKQSLRN